MNQISPNCPRCGGEMNEGFIADYTYGAIRPSDWVKGEPVKSVWVGTKVRGKEQYKVKTFRCVGCGFLESYAVEIK